MEQERFRRFLRVLAIVNRARDEWIEHLDGLLGLELPEAEIGAEGHGFGFSPAREVAWVNPLSDDYLRRLGAPLAGRAYDGWRDDRGVGCLVRDVRKKTSRGVQAWRANGVLRGVDLEPVVVNELQSSDLAWEGLEWMGFPTLTDDPVKSEVRVLALEPDEDTVYQDNTIAQGASSLFAPPGDHRDPFAREMFSAFANTFVNATKLYRGTPEGDVGKGDAFMQLLDQAATPRPRAHGVTIRESIIHAQFWSDFNARSTSWLDWIRFQWTPAVVTGYKSRVPSWPDLLDRAAMRIGAQLPTAMSPEMGAKAVEWLTTNAPRDGEYDAQAARTKVARGVYALGYASSWFERGARYHKDGQPNSVLLHKLRRESGVKAGANRTRSVNVHWAALLRAIWRQEKGDVAAVADYLHLLRGFYQSELAAICGERTRPSEHQQLLAGRQAVQQLLAVQAQRAVAPGRVSTYASHIKSALEQEELRTVVTETLVVAERRSQPVLEPGYYNETDDDGRTILTRLADGPAEE